jgi:hypothetical protein
MKRPEEKYLVDTQALTQNTLTALPLVRPQARADKPRTRLHIPRTKPRRVGVPVGVIAGRRGVDVPVAVAETLANPTNGRPRSSDRRPQTTDHRPETRRQPGRQRSTFNAQRSTLNAQRSTLNAQRSTLNVQRSTLNAQRSTLNAQRSTLNAQHSRPHTVFRPLTSGL